MLICQKNSRILVLPLYLFFFLNSHGQENKEIISANNDSEIFINKEPFEKTFLHTDKDFYYHNETIWLNLFLLNSNSHLSSTKSQVVFIELLDEDNNLISQKKLYVENKSTAGHIDVNSSFKPGTYTIRAYTLYMQNEGGSVPFEKQITISGPEFRESLNDGKGGNKQINYKSPSSFESNLQVQFFPEGGQMVNGIETSIGIKITDENEKGVASEGKIIDEENQIISFFKSQEFGLGVFKILPLANKKYFAVLSNGLKYELPERKSDGYIINVKSKAKVIVIDVTTNISQGLEGLRLLGYLRGQIIYNQKIVADKNNDSYKVRILTEGLPTGVAEFTLLATNGDSICKRLVFIHQIDNEVVVSIDTSNKEPSVRQKVSAKINLNDKEDKPLIGAASLSVTMIDRIDVSNNAHSMKNWLLLNSDIGSAIANPGYFFENDSINKPYLLDALMICMGSGLNDQRETLTPETELKSFHRPEKGIMITGKTVDFATKSKPKQALVKINLLGTTDGVYNEEQVTDSLGNFNFGPYVFNDTIKAIINSESLEKRRNGKSKKLAIQMIETPSLNKVGAKIKNRNSFILQDDKLTSPVSSSARSKTPDFPVDSNVIQLEEAFVSKKKKTRKDSIDKAIRKLSPLYSNPSRRLFIDSIPGATGLRVFDLLVRRGARLRGSFPDEEIWLRQDFSGNPLFVVDGIETDAAMVDAMNTAGIEFIDILFPTNAGAYINKSAFGVVAIYTKGSLNLPQKRKSIAIPNIKGIEVSGFSSVKNFQITDYSKSKHEQEKPDNRSTLFWQPELKLGNSEISFYTSDIPGTYIIKVEGVTNDGRPISAMKAIEVKEK